VKYVGGVYGNQRPTEFLCLLLKLLQIQPEKEILVEYLRADEFKYAFSFIILGWLMLHRYLRALAAFYVRMTFRPVDIYELLEPMLRDYGKLRMRNMCEFSLCKFRILHSPS
jgi:pre-mRNA-splicing factor 38A